MNFTDLFQDETRPMNCQWCGKEIPVNVAYPIEKVTCLECRIEQVKRSEAQS